MAPPSPYQVQLKRLAAHISREVREQWVQVERVAQYKHDQRLEAARKVRVIGLRVRVRIRVRVRLKV